MKVYCSSAEARGKPLDFFAASGSYFAVHWLDGTYSLWRQFRSYEMEETDAEYAKEIPDYELMGLKVITEDEFKERTKAARERSAAEREARERKAYERLKAKFEGGKE